MNIIFDIGGVTLSWSNDLFLSHSFNDKKDYDTAYNYILNTPLWARLDKGTISHKEAIKISSEKSGLHESTVEKFIDSVPDVLQPIEATIDIIRELKGKGHKLYVLSNMGIEAAASIEEKYNFWEFFDGIMFSARVKMVKPDDEIFLHIAEKYDLNINNTIFIDDTEKNIKTASKLGFKTIHFDSSEQCREELKALQCL